MNQTEEPNYYQILNINPEAGVSEIVHAYHEICQKFSIFPYASEDELNLINSDFVIYKRAYIVLTSAEDRKLYDEALKNKISEAQKQAYIKSISETSDLESILFLNDAPKLNDREEKFSKIKTEIINNMFDKAKHYLENDKYHEAINMFRKLIDINNKEACYHSFLGLTLLKKGWDSYAHEEFRNALLCDPDDAIALEHCKLRHLTSKLNSKVTARLDLQEEHERKSVITGILDKLKSFFKKVNYNLQ